MHLQMFVVFVIANAIKSQLITSLYSVLDYGILNGVNDINFLIGVAITKGQLNTTQKLVGNDKSQITVLQSLQQKCDILLEPIFRLKDPLALALSPNLWTLDPPIHSLPQIPQSVLPPFISQFTESGSLSRSLSDSCLRSLLSECSLPKECVSAELNEQASGYTLTHQLLYWTIFDKKCNKNNVNNVIIEAMIRHKCSRIYGQHRNILALGLPSALLDLYFEQVVVCGLHGFLPFLSLQDQDLLFTLQSPEGCFAQYKREHHHGCDLHLSGVCTAALSILVKHQFHLV